MHFYMIDYPMISATSSVALADLAWSLGLNADQYIAALKKVAEDRARPARTTLISAEQTASRRRLREKSVGKLAVLQEKNAKFDIYARKQSEWRAQNGGGEPTRAPLQKMFEEAGLEAHAASLTSSSSSSSAAAS